MKMVRVAFLFIILATAISCKTVSLDNINSIPIPEGITTTQAIAGVVLASDPTKMPKQWTNNEKILGKAVMSALVFPGLGMGDQYADGRWRVEEVRDEYAVLGYSTSKHYVRVKYQVVEGNVVPTVEFSENLSEGWGRLHRNGVMWINRLSPIIRESIWQIKTIREESLNENAAETTRRSTVEGLIKEGDKQNVDENGK